MTPITQSPLTEKRAVSVPELLCSPVIIRGGGGGKRGVTVTEKILNELDPSIKPNIVMRAESPVAVKSAVQNGMGVGLLFEDLVYNDLKDGKFKRLKVRDSKLESPVFLIYHGERGLSPNAHDFLKLLREWRNKNAVPSKRSMPGKKMPGQPLR